MKPYASKKHGGKGGAFKSKKKGAPFYKKKKTQVTFDAEARRQYLQGFSERKRQRRAYGLAMQKVKDRKSRIEEKRETKQADLERIEQAESQKKELLYEKHGGVIEGDEEEDDSAVNNEDTTTTTMYQDTQTQSQFGGQVIVTTTTMPPSDDEDESGETSHEVKHVDSQQRYAGNVNKFLHELKGNMPGKKQRDSGKHKGRHGAASMKGMGGDANLKVAQKALSKMQAKKAKNERKGRSGGKRKR